MPVAGKLYLKKIELPGYPDDDKAHVTIVTNPKADVWENIDPNNASDSQNSIIARIITEWNFTDEAGQPLPITPDNVKMALSALDMVHIMDSLGISGLTDKKKKELILHLSDRSSPPPREYILLCYRRTFHLTHQQVREIDLNDLLADLEMISLEGEYQIQSENSKTMQGESTSIY